MLSMINYFDTLNSNVSSGLLKQVEKKVVSVIKARST